MNKYEESNVVELKREITEDLKKEIIAFLNTRGGMIFVGVDNDGSLVPFKTAKQRDEVNLKIAGWLQDSIYPISTNQIEYKFNNDHILEIKIEEGPNKPYYLKDKGPRPEGVYKRVGSSKRKVSEDEILRMIMSSNNYVYENDTSDEQKLTFNYLEQAFKKEEITFNERLMLSLGIKNKNKVFTNLGFLLSDQSNIVVKYAEYDESLNFNQKKEFKGPLNKILNDIEEQINKINIISAVIDGTTFKRKETKSYPDPSLREMIINAICHADYFIRSNIKIEFYKDKARITNPGGVYNASLEDVMNGIQTYRNPKLVNILDKLHYIENYGTGIPRTINAYKYFESKPSFNSTENFFVVELPNVSYKKDFDQINDLINDQINDLGLEILKLVKDNPGINVPTMIIKLKAKNKEISADQIRNEIKRELKGYIKHSGSNKTGGYFLE